nr:myelin-associated glycoprotein-like [Misgurnus anguillicaudatus]
MRIRSVEHKLKMHLISSCIILFMMILNILCQGTEIKDWNISFTPAEVTAVPGVCVVISSTFSYPNTAKPKNLQLYQCKDGNQCNGVTEKTKVIKCDLDKNKCNIIINNISAEDEGEYAFRVEGDQSYTYRPRFKITIQDKPVINIPPLREGQEANLSCSAPAPCPKTPPDITWWIKQNEKSIKLKKITFTTSEGFYVATLTIMPTADLHNATIECKATYGNTIISTSMTIEVKSLT